MNVYKLWGQKRRPKNLLNDSLFWVGLRFRREFYSLLSVTFWDIIYIKTLAAALYICIYTLLCLFEFWGEENNCGSLYVCIGMPDKKKEIRSFRHLPNP